MLGIVAMNDPAVALTKKKVISIELSLEAIKRLCGESFYKRGRTYYNEGSVAELKEEQGGARYTAHVSGSEDYQVQIDWESSRKIESWCSCPAYDIYGPCKHIAAVLIALYEQQKASGKHTVAAGPVVRQPVVRQEPRATTRPMLIDKLIDGFANSGGAAVSASDAESPLAPREQAQIQFVFKVQPGYLQRRPRVTVELKVGVKRLYVVSQIREFLDCIRRRGTFYFTAHFTFDWAKHRLTEAEAELLDRFYDMKETEALYREMLSGYAYGHTEGRSLLIAPSMWDSVAAYLGQVDAVLEQHDEPSPSLFVVERNLPLQFKLQALTDRTYQLQAQGLTVLQMLPIYGCALEGGSIYRISERQAQLLEQLQVLFNQPESREGLELPGSRMHRFVQEVLPQLEALGEVELDQQVLNRISRLPLEAGFYLDYEQHRLKIRCEFRYGSIRFNPLNHDPDLPSGLILIREQAAEARILAWMDSEWLHQEHDVWITRTEEELYQTLYGTVAEIERAGLALYWSAQARRLVREQRTTPTIEARLASGLDWFEVLFEVDEMDEADKEQVLQAIVLKKKYTRLRGGLFVSLEEERFDELKHTMDSIGVTPKELSGATVRLPAVRALLLPPRSEHDGAPKWGPSLRYFLERLQHPGDDELRLPELLQVVLRSYQIEGLQWLNRLSEFRLGGILADDMGLGKTLQSIAYVCSELEAAKHEHVLLSPILIVCPASLSLNWAAEFARFAPTVRVIVPSGSKAERRATLDDLASTDIVITSYPLLLRDREWYAEESFHALILDEAQMIKNAASQTAKAVRSISSVRRFALTGTPVENSLEDLWSIFNAVSPGLFGSKKSFLGLPSDRIAALSAPFILRRLKKEVLQELPDRIDTLHYSELTGEQKNVYTAYLSVLHTDTQKRIEEDGFSRSRIEILAGITRLRQLCCHPSLFIDGYEGGSGKLEQLLELLEECRESGRRVLVFSQFASMLEIIRSELSFLDEAPFYLVGSTPTEERVELCRRFNEGEGSVFLISLKAGGIGLNLTGADTVILYDLWWNPAVEEQAIGRAHRMGQQRVVQVIRLIAQGTIEEKMFELQERKRELIAEVVDLEREPIAAGRLTEEDIRMLLGIG